MRYFIIKVTKESLYFYHENYKTSGPSFKHLRSSQDTVFKRVISTVVFGLNKLVPLHFVGLLLQRKLTFDGPRWFHFWMTVPCASLF